MIEAVKKYLEARTHNAVEFFALTRIRNAGSDPEKRSTAVLHIADLLSNFSSDVIRDSYVEILTKHPDAKWLKATALKKEIGEKQKAIAQKAVQVAEKKMQSSIPEVYRGDVMRYGFYKKIDRETQDPYDNATGYYFRYGSEEGSFKQVSNFVFEPLFHKPDDSHNTRFIRIENGVGDSEIIELPSEALLGVDAFRKYLFNQGSYFFEGSISHLNKLNKRYLHEFPKAWELKTLGWQQEGFFSFYDKVFDDPYEGGGLRDFDDAGMIKHKDRFYYSPAISGVYKDIRKEDDLFENDRFLSYSQSPLKFGEWASLFTDTYEEHAKAGIPYIFVCLFRDIVFKVDNNCPLLYFYGPSKSGKSKCAESLLQFFFKGLGALNLNNATDYAFANRLERFRNCLVWLNEFDDKDLDPKRFQIIKGSFDGEGREKGTGVRKKTEIQKVNSGIMLTGQYLSTKDDNSVLSRSIPRPFAIKYDRSAKQMAAYNKLKKVEASGISSLVTDLLEYRGYVEDKYYMEFNQVFKDLAAAVKAKLPKFEERVLRNYAALATMVKLFEKKFDFPWTYEDYRLWCIKEIIGLSRLISRTDILKNFWNSLETMLDDGTLKENVHFKVEELSRVKITNEEGQQEDKHFGEPTKVLFLRVSNVQQLYAKFKRSMGENGIDVTSLETYLKQRDYFVGTTKNTRFNKTRVLPDGSTKVTSTPTSAAILKYDEVGVSLTRDVEYEQKAPTTDPAVKVANKDLKPDDDLPF